MQKKMQHKDTDNMTRYKKTSKNSTEQVLFAQITQKFIIGTTGDEISSYLKSPLMPRTNMRT